MNLRQPHIEVHVPESPFVTRVKDAIELVMHDLLLGAERLVPEGFSLHIKDLESPGALMVVTEHDGSRAGFGVFAAESPQELLVKVASGLQDHFIEFFMIASPVFPGSQVPLSARVRKIATWESMRDPQLFSCPIGQYPGK